MDRKIKIIAVLILCLFGYSEAQDTGLIPVPVFTDAKIQSQVGYDSAAGLYAYNYTITNPPTNTGKIWAIAIDISQPPNGVILNSEGLTIPRGGEIVTFEEELPSESLKPVLLIPVGMRVPFGWDGGLAAAGTARFSSGDAPEILPGESLGGFEIISRGLPTIREVKIEPWWIYSTAGFATEEGAQRAREIEASLPYKTKTLGPTAPPADFKAVSFIDSIISMKHEAFSLGWITNQGIEQSLDAKLENSKMEIVQGNTNTAKNILAAFINEVEAQKDKHLTSEGYGLLKYNVQYLIEKL